MASGKLEPAGLLAAWHLAGIAGMFGGQLDPNEINPYRLERPPSRAMQELLAWRRKRAMKSFARDIGRAARKG